MQTLTERYIERYSGKLAVITGAGTGMGRELAVVLASHGADVALCDVNGETLAETQGLCQQASPDAAASTFLCDVSNEQEVIAFRDHTVAAHSATHIDLLFNNAGIGGVGSIFDDRDAWERTFNVCWFGVYYPTRAFLDLLQASNEAHIVNTSSINGFWASIGPSRSHTAYSAAKFAVKGFTEALITDLRMNAPQIKASVVMPGHIGTEIVENSRQVLGAEATPERSEVAAAFRNLAPTTARQAADVILEGVMDDRWRILIGEDAEVLDGMVRDDPEAAYEPEFVDRLHAAGVLQSLVH